MNSVKIFFNKLKTDRIFRFNFIKSLVIFALFYWFLFYVARELKESNILNYHNIEVFVNHYKSVSWLAYILLLVVAIMSPLPDTPTVLVGGYIFGPVVATVLTIIAQILGATADFYLARKLGKGFVTKKFPESVTLLNNYSEKLGWQTIFLMRLTPTLSFDMLSYASGLSSLSFKKYIVATAGGMIPLIVITTLLGYSASIHSRMFAVSTLVVGSLFVVLTAYIFKKIFKQNKISIS